mmetsp:Transcript_3490/g.8247  ORF Transcript_3490/g.8247 Transcript_3490/m.8247 type:complete len:242 (-) Transcript_3490:55-780(-)
MPTGLPSAWICFSKSLITAAMGRFTAKPPPRSCSASPIARACEISTSCSMQLSSTSVPPYCKHRKLRAATLPSAARPFLHSRRRDTLPKEDPSAIPDFFPISRARCVTSFTTYSSIMMTASATAKKSPLPPTTRMVETSRSLKSGRTLVTKAVMGSFSGETKAFIFSSRIMKLVAQVSSSTSKVLAPTSSASMMLAAWEVDPEASPVVNSVVAFPNGKLLMKGEMSVHFTDRPSSARIFTA